MKRVVEVKVIDCSNQEIGNVRDQPGDSAPEPARRDAWTQGGVVVMVTGVAVMVETRSSIRPARLKL